MSRAKQGLEAGHDFWTLTLGDIWHSFILGYWVMTLFRPFTVVKIVYNLTSAHRRNCLSHILQFLKIWFPPRLLILAASMLSAAPSAQRLFRSEMRARAKTAGRGSSIPYHTIPCCGKGSSSKFQAGACLAPETSTKPDNAIEYHKNQHIALFICFRIDFFQWSSTRYLKYWYRIPFIYFK